MRGTGRGGDKSAQDTHKLSSSPLHLSSPSSVASMVLYAFFYASGGSDPSETLGCRSHTRTDLTLARFLVIKTQLRHLDLLAPIHMTINDYIDTQKNKKSLAEYQETQSTILYYLQIIWSTKKKFWELSKSKSQNKNVT